MKSQTASVGIALLLLSCTARADVVNVLRNLLGGAQGGAENKTETAEAPKPAEPARIRWNNGESIPGEILDGSASAVRWTTPVFADPLEVSWHVLRRIDKKQTAVDSKEPFGFVLRDGSFLCGDLAEISDKTATIRSARHGDVVVKRAELLSVRRLSGADIIVGGPAGDVGWSPMPGDGRQASQPSVGPAVGAFFGGAGGALVLPYWNRGVTVKVTLPEVMEVEFRVRSSQRPDFRIGLARMGTTMNQMSVETWDDQLVLARGDDFHFIRKIAEDEREIALRACWDTSTKKCAIYSTANELLTEWQPPDAVASATAGINVFNKGRDLALEHLRVRKWDGQAPVKVDAKLPRLMLASGQVIVGEVTRGSAGALHVRVSGESAEREVKLAEIDDIRFSPDAMKSDIQPMMLSFADGTHLKGKLESIQGGSIAMRTSFADAPVMAKTDALRQMKIEVPSPDGKPPEFTIVDMDNLKFATASLHGKLVADGAAQPKWTAIGGVKPASLKPGDAFEITRAFPAGSPIPTSPALFFTASGDVLPGSLRGIDKNGVEMDSEIMEEKKLPSSALNAVQFGAAAQLTIKGFADPAWRVIKGDEKTVKHDEKTLSLEPGTSIGHVAAMQASEVKFSMAYGGMSTVRLRLFCAGIDTEKSSNVVISHWGSHVYSGLEAGENQLLEQQRTSVPSSKPINVRLVVKEKAVELNLNGALMQTFNIPPSKRVGSGLVIEPMGVWGNTVNAITLTNFSAQSVPGMTWLPDINAETKMHALMVPRFRRDDPSRHALIAANGDVLRGEIESATATHFSFRSGLEELRVPRDRVKAAVWLKKPLADAPAASAEASPTQKLLDQRIGRRTTYSSADLRTLISVLEREAAGLKFVLPAKTDSRRFRMPFGGQSVGEALDEICKLFGLRHSFDKDGKIVLAEAPSIPKGLFEKSRWVKAGAFSDKTLVQEVLASKGVAFPNGSSVTWYAAASQLTMVNTPENQAKLDEVLARDFGGSLGSPTHWLLLTSGARLGLTVEKFQAETIDGRHPVYGVCHVPMQQVYTIRTSKPDPTSTMNALGEWRLVNAPEPVLPETGGESSPLLGKPAPPFKLPLLGGGELDLAKERGKVIVLDFWATWCGPCIKSLPGVIEAMSQFPSDKVRLIGANQGEGGEVVKRFLEARKLTLTVAMDGTQSVARQYGVDGIPHTVIIDQEGKVAWVKTGYSPEGHTEAAEIVKGLLEKHP